MEQFVPDITRQQIWQEFAGHFRNKETAVAYLAEIREFEHVCSKRFLQSGENEAEQYYSWLKKKNDAGKISGSTLGKKLWELHSFAAFAAERRGAYGIPYGFRDYFYSWLKVAGHEEKFVQSVPIEDMDALYESAQKNLTAYTIITLIHRVGLSSTEVGELKYKDLSSYENGVFAYLTSREEFCLIPPDAVQILESYLKAREDNEYLFYNKRGSPLNKMFISRMLKKYTEKAGIPAYSAQKIRSTCGITMFAYGAGPGQVAKQMGITGTQIKKYQNRHYKENLLLKANELVKIKVEPPV